MDKELRKVVNDLIERVDKLGKIEEERLTQIQDFTLELDITLDEILEKIEIIEEVVF